MLDEKQRMLFSTLPLASQPLQSIRTFLDWVIAPALHLVKTSTRLNASCSNTFLRNFSGMRTTGSFFMDDTSAPPASHNAGIASLLIYATSKIKRHYQPKAFNEVHEDLYDLASILKCKTRRTRKHFAYVTITNTAYKIHFHVRSSKKCRVHFLSIKTRHWTTI